MPAPVRIGDRLGSYRIVRLIGEGGFGAVYEVEHEELGRRAAAKVLSLDATRHPGVLERFRLEARASSRIPHPAIVQIFEVGQTPEGVPWFLMELIQGHTLGAHMRAALKARGRPLGEDGLFFIHELAGALTAAHEAGVVHRDIKPSNAMIIDDHEHGERIKLLDFGIAKLVSDSLGVDDPGKPDTRTGALLGTPLYMAPEQCRMTAGTKLDGQADVYALGVILYELFAGRAPFAEIPEPLALMMSKLVDELPPLAERAPEAPKEMVALTMSMLERDPKQRPTMAEVKARLGAFLRVPAARRSGFLPYVAPPEKLADKLADKRVDPDPSLPPTESGPLLPDAAKIQPAAAGQDAPVAKPPLAVTSAGVMPPTPPEYSSGQLARPAVSLSQQPTQQQRRGPRGLRWGLVGAGLSLSVTVVIVLWNPTAKQQDRPAVVRAASVADLAVASSEPSPSDKPTPAVDKLAPAPEPQHETDNQATNLAVAPTVRRSTSRPRCQPVALTSECVFGRGLDESLRLRVVQAVRSAGVRLCSGDALKIRVAPREAKLVEVPASIGQDKREVLPVALIGEYARAQSAYRGEIIVQCK
ncbi:MAG: protein kinase [Polyangia bacterium]